MEYIPSKINYSFPKKDELLTNIPNWKIDPSRSVLLIHDMQQFFLNFFAEEMKNILIKNISLMKKWAYENNVTVAYSLQPGGMTKEQRGLLKDFWGEGMRMTSEDRAVPDEICPKHDDWLLTKWRYSAFFKSDLIEMMRKSKKDQLIITGVYGHIGILMTSLESYTNDFETFIIEDAIADFSKDLHIMTLNYTAKCCAALFTVGEIIK
jgi:Isochorismate hydrolase